MLNDIVANIDMKSQKLKASYLLDNLRDNVRKALRQDNNALSGLDGIDMALVLIDSERQMLQYSGACRPLIMVRNNELTKFDPDRMNIGIYGKDEQFTNHEIEIEPGDCFYAYSDGITDQFCNTGEDQKFGRRRLYEMLLENSTASFDEQLQTYQRTFEQWRQSDASKAPASQTDDVLLVGIKIA